MTSRSLPVSPRFLLAPPPCGSGDLRLRDFMASGRALTNTLVRKDFEGSTGRAGLWYLSPVCLMCETILLCTPRRTSFRLVSKDRDSWRAEHPPSRIKCEQVDDAVLGLFHPDNCSRMSVMLKNNRGSVGDDDGPSAEQTFTDCSRRRMSPRLSTGEIAHYPLQQRLDIWVCDQLLEYYSGECEHTIVEPRKVY